MTEEMRPAGAVSSAPEPQARGRRSLPGAITSLLVAVAVAVAVFPAVFFLGGSLSSVSLSDVLGARQQTGVVSVVPNPENLEPRSGELDVGARVWQFEAATRFMERVIDDGDSAEWNPYSAAGSLGPETMADMKESPFVLIVALLGASATAFTVVMLAFIILALYCLQQFFIRTLGMSRMAGIGACIVFLLNGWAAGVLTSQTSAPYLLFPVVLYTLTEYQRVGGRIRLLIAVGAYAGLFATTFLPSVVLVVLLVQSVALALDIWRRRELHPDESRGVLVGRVLLRQAMVPGLAVLVTAYIWIPNLVALRNGGEELRAYSSLDLATKSPIEALSILTPRQFYRWYLPESLPSDLVGVKWTIYLGIAPLIVVGAALPRSQGPARRLLVLVTGLALFGLAMHAGVPLVKSIGYLPGLRPISGAYWASLAAAAFTLAFGVAIDTARSRGFSLPIAAVLGAAFVAMFVVGLATRDVTRTIALFVTLAVALIVVTVALAWASTRWPTRRILLAGVAVAIVGAELFSYQNHQMPRRTDVEDHLPGYVDFLRENLGDARIVNVGRRAIYAEWGAALGIRQVETLNIVQLPWYREFFSQFVNPAESGGKFLEVGRSPRSPFSAVPDALDQLSVRYLVVDTRYRPMDEQIAERYPLVFEDEKARVRVYENPTAFPRAYVSPALISWAERPRGDRWRQSFAVTEDSTLLEDARSAGVSDAVDGPPADATASIVEDRNTRVTVEVETTQPSMLVLADAYHSNWNVTVNGEPAHVGRVNDAFRGVVVPAGTSTVTFEYESIPRRVGAAVSLTTVALLVLGTALSAVRDRRRRAVASDELVGRSQDSPVG